MIIFGFCSFPDATVLWEKSSVFKVDQKWPADVWSEDPDYIFMMEKTAVLPVSSKKHYPFWMSVATEHLISGFEKFINRGL